MNNMVCPRCGAEMVLRSGKRKFHGCSRFPYCTGKRDITGTSFSFDDDEEKHASDFFSAPSDLSKETVATFYAGIEDGMSYREAYELSLEWQRCWEDD